MNRWLYTLVVTGCIAALSGCANDSAVGEHFGDAYREAIARSTDDPEGSAMNASLRPPTGFDGTTSEQVMGKYRASLAPMASPTLPLPMIVTESSSLGNAR